MMDLERQIHDYYDHIIIPVTADEYSQSDSRRSVPSHRSRTLVLAVAFVVVLVGVGITILMPGGNGSSFVDHPEAPVMTVPGTSMTSGDPAAPVLPGVAGAQAGWIRVAADEPWVESIVDIEAMPGDGFVIRAADPWSLYWSSDGVEWLDADPTGQIDVYQLSAVDARTGAQVIAASSDRVAILDRSSTSLWVGDPETGEWAQIHLDTTGFVGATELLAVESNGTDFMVVALANGLATLEDTTVDPDDDPPPTTSIDQYTVWVVDPAADTVDRYPLPIAAHSGQVDDTVVEWFNGRWVIYLAMHVPEEPEGKTEEESLLVSPDGAAWTMTTVPQEWGMSLTSLTAGSTSMVATVCHFGGDSFWYSDDGLNWTKSTSTYLGHHSGYTDELGFIVIYGDILKSTDGRTWQPIKSPNDQFSGVDHLAASGNLLLIGDGLRDEEKPTLWLWESQ